MLEHSTIHMYLKFDGFLNCKFVQFLSRTSIWQRQWSLHLHNTTYIRIQIHSSSGVVRPATPILKLTRSIPRLGMTSRSFCNGLFVLFQVCYWITVQKVQKRKVNPNSILFYVAQTVSVYKRTERDL